MLCSGAAADNRSRATLVSCVLAEQVEADRHERSEIEPAAADERGDPF